VVPVDIAALEQYLGWIVRESAAFTATIRADTLERAVPSCPAWQVRDLAWHLGRVQEFWADDVTRAADAEPDFSGERTAGPDDAVALAAWLEARTAKLVANLRETPTATEVCDLTATPTGRGYWIIADDGMVYVYGDARNAGNAAATHARFTGIAHN